MSARQVNVVPVLEHYSALIPPTKMLARAKMVGPRGEQELVYRVDDEGNVHVEIGRRRYVVTAGDVVQAVVDSLNVEGKVEAAAVAEHRKVCETPVFFPEQAEDVGGQFVMACSSCAARVAVTVGQGGAIQVTPVEGKPTDVTAGLVDLTAGLQEGK